MFSNLRRLLYLAIILAYSKSLYSADVIGWHNARVIAKNSNSHASLGWHKLTDEIIETISLKKKNIVFMLWGAFAHKKEALIDKKKHFVLKTSHPSPFSAYRGFIGSGVFVKCNEYLIKNGCEPVVW